MQLTPRLLLYKTLMETIATSDGIFCATFSDQRHTGMSYKLRERLANLPLVALIPGIPRLPKLAEDHHYIINGCFCQLPGRCRGGRAAVGKYR